MTTAATTQLQVHLLLAHRQEQPDRLAQVREALHGVGARCDADDCVSLGDVSVRLAQRRPSAVILLWPRTEPAITPAIKEISRSGVPVVVLGPPIDPAGLVELLRAGAREYVELDPGEGRMTVRLSDCFDRLAERGDIAAAPGRSVGVLAAVPGVGVTTVASGMAFAMALKSPRQVALAELGVSVPQLALLLDQRPTSSLGELAARCEHADTAMVRQAMVAHPAGVDLLLEKPGELRPTRPQPAEIRRLVTLLRVLYRQSVLDLGCDLSPANLEAIRLSDVAVIVCRLDVPCIHLTRRLIEELDRREVAASKVRVVFNRYGERGQLDSASAVQALGTKPAGWLPDAPRLVNAARNRGVPLEQVARASSLTRELGKLAARIATTR
jgi:Flp pilus assembly CpaE family ATPase